MRLTLSLEPPKLSRKALAAQIKAASDAARGYVCPHCGKRHVSDDTELWCAIAKQNQEKPK